MNSLVLRLLCLLLIIILNGCAIFEMDMKQAYEFEIFNDTNEEVVIQSFNKSNVLDNITIQPKSTFLKTSDDDYPSFFNPNLKDSIVYSNPSKSISYFCNGYELNIDYGCTPAMVNSPLDLSTYTYEPIGKTKKRVRIIGKYSYIIKASLFE